MYETGIQHRRFQYHKKYVQGNLKVSCLQFDFYLNWAISICMSLSDCHCEHLKGARQSLGNWDCFGFASQPHPCIAQFRQIPTGAYKKRIRQNPRILRTTQKSPWESIGVRKNKRKLRAGRPMRKRSFHWRKARKEPIPIMLITNGNHNVAAINVTCETWP